MNEKQLIAAQAAQRIQTGMCVGLGTGSTANLFIEALAARVSQEQLQINCVASSVISAIKARQSGLTLVSLELLSALDVYVDGADEVAPDLTVLKGRGSDLVREKLLAQASREFWVLADSSKFVNYIGERYPIPLEVMPFAWQMVKAQLEALGGRGDLRPNAAKDGLHVSSHGSLVLDMTFNGDNIHTLNQTLNGVAGIVEHGIFVNLATEVIRGDSS